MANIDIKRLSRNDQKVSRCASAAVITPADLDAGQLASGDVVTLFTLPANADVTNAYIYVGTGATGGTQTMKISVGGTDVISAVAVGTADGAFKGGAVTRVNSGTGADVTVTTGVATLTDGSYRVVVEYVESDKVTGELTN